MEIEIDAKGMHYRELNEKIRKIIKENPDIKKIILKNVLGQRFIGNSLRKKDLTIEIYGTPGGDLGMFMSGPTIIVHGNCEFAPGNTMDDGLIVIHGDSGDVTAHSMRGGKVFVKGDVGYRSGIHMKAYKDKVPILVIGGRAKDFLGEYMAGGKIIVLNIDKEGNDLGKVKGRMIGTGIHGGAIYIRGDVEKDQLGVAADIKEFTEEDLKEIEPYIEEFCKHFNFSEDVKEMLINSKWTKIAPISKRPFGKLYTPDLM
ncbi:glutamate synthase subunit alpha [Methanocaldococcus villosus KIN24-T80]|uniref:Glutamate synthase subunit alpha n=1 Tax=Methanocaldococcus villosus KIN24-T80 TaxID=1069083 RepID=N6VPA0_9EURY|nr:glutamate synthase subunit alpha [Methanocaldococcus villosus]ENN95700.1 glutamate synthase subunit alpha [Methanocaldococcus villosus KIN24-T80]